MLMPVSHKYKIIFIHIPKCGGTTIDHLLDIIDYSDQHYTLLQLKNKLNPDIFNGYKKITVVRNPYTRLLSEYVFRSRFITRQPLTFEQYIHKGSEYLNTTQSAFLYNEQGNLNSINTIYKFENMNTCIDDINIITGKSGYVHLNKSTYTKPVEEYYTPELREIVYNTYKEDFINFGYDGFTQLTEASSHS
jgi:hypothetical protein